jgi:hypothetical protein
MKRYVLDLPKSLIKDIKKFTKDTGMPEAEYFRRSFSLFLVATEEVQKGNEVVILDNSNEVIGKVKGII